MLGTMTRNDRGRPPGAERTRGVDERPQVDGPQPGVERPVGERHGEDRVERDQDEPTAEEPRQRRPCRPRSRRRRARSVAPCTGSRVSVSTSATRLRHAQVAPTSPSAASMPRVTTTAPIANIAENRNAVPNWGSRKRRREPGERPPVEDVVGTKQHSRHPLEREPGDGEEREQEEDRHREHEQPGRGRGQPSGRALRTPVGRDVFGIDDLGGVDDAHRARRSVREAPGPTRWRTREPAARLMIRSLIAATARHGGAARDRCRS